MALERVSSDATALREWGRERIPLRCHPHCACAFPPAPRSPHCSVVFAGFSADSLRDRILDARSKWVVTANEGRRGGRSIPLKHTTDIAVAQCACVERVFVYNHTETEVPFGMKDVDMKVSGGHAWGRPPASTH